VKERRDWMKWINEKDKEDNNCNKDDERKRVDSAEMMWVCFDWCMRLRTTLKSIFCNNHHHHFFVCILLVNNSSSLHRMHTTR